MSDTLTHTRVITAPIKYDNGDKEKVAFSTVCYTKVVIIFICNP